MSTQVALNRKTIAHLENMEEIERFQSDMQSELIDLIKKRIIDEDIEFTGDLRESVKKGKEDDFATVEIDSPYAGIVEWGLLPGVRPNFDALRNWVRIKLGITDDEESMIATIKISNKIENKGIAPKLFVKKSIKALIARRGSITVRARRPKSSRITRLLKKMSKMISRTNRGMRKINKYIGKVSSISRGKIT